MLHEDYEKFPENYDSSSVRIINTPDVVAKKTFFYVQETGYLKIITSHRTERYNLDSFLIVYVVSGSGTLEYDGKKYSVKKGACFFIDCMKRHSYYSGSANPWSLLWVHFNGATSKQYFDVFYKRSTPVYYPQDALKTESTLRECIEVNREHNFDGEIRSSMLVMSLLTQALNGRTRRAAQVNETALRTKQYINNHFTEKITLDWIESELYMSRFHIEKEFKKYYGITIFEYIISKRINLAKRLLRFTDKSIEEIALMCGFSDQSYFNRQFKKAEGMTGSAFRKKWRSAE